MTEFTTGLPAATAHSALETAVKTMADAKQNAVLWFGDILQRKLYQELGYATMGQYATRALGFSPARASDFMNICRKLKKLPKLAAKLKSGELGYTQARVLVNVVDEKNEDQWLQYARQNSRRDLEQEVKRARKTAAAQAKGQPSLLPSAKTGPEAVVPVSVRLEMSPTQFARYEALWEQIRKQGNAPSGQVEALLAIMESFSFPRGKNSSDRPPVQIHIHQCPACEKAVVQTSRGELALTPAEREKAHCDGQISRPGARNTTTIPPKTRREVLARDRHRCQQPGCGNTRYLEVHHVVPRSRGGTNAADNLICLCSACHGFRHLSPKKQPPMEMANHSTGAVRAIP